MFLRVVIVALLSFAAFAQQPARVGEFSIAGVLVDSVTAQPVANARVAISSVERRDDSTTVVTGEDGRFSFSNLAKGKYALSAERRGYVSQSFNQHEGYYSSIAVCPDIDSSNIVFRLPPESAISGTILDDAGEPVRDAQVMLFKAGISGGMEGTRRNNQTSTDDRGFYHFGHLTPGRYVVVVTARVWYAQRPRAPWQPTRTTFTGDSPSSFSSVSGGGQIIPEKPEQENNLPLDLVYPITFFPGTTDPAAATPIVLRDGERFVADLSLQPVRALHLEFSGTELSAGHNRYLMLERKLFDGVSIPVLAETRVSATGAMELVGVPPGQYTVKMAEPGNGQPTGAHEINAVNSGPAVPVEIQGARVSLALQLDPGTPRPTQSYLQIFNMKTRAYHNARITDSDELEYGENIPPGTYEIAITNGRGTFIRSVTATGAKVTGRNIDIKTTGRVKLNVRLSQGMGTVNGTALRDGKPFAGAMVVLAPADPGDNSIIFRRDQSDSDGTFSLQGAIPGKYTVIAIDNGWDLEWRDMRILKPYLAQGTPVNIQPDGKYDVKVNVQ